LLSYLIQYKHIKQVASTNLVVDSAHYPKTGQPYVAAYQEGRSTKALPEPENISV
jgi:hypothetical protein